MYARRTRSPAGRRRGVVLILVLAMMGLLAVIGVSFATFSGQARSGAQAFSGKLNRPRVDTLLDYAVAQLINDTTNPMSALYGHGLKRDMYGADAATNGIYQGTTPRIGSVQLTPSDDWSTVIPGIDPTYPARWRVTTTIPYDSTRSFLGWSLILDEIPATSSTPYYVSQSFQVVLQGNNGGVFQFDITGSHKPGLALNMTQPDFPFTPHPITGITFTLDGRFRNAFNGAGMAAWNASADIGFQNGTPNDPSDDDPGNRLAGQFANFRLSGGVLTGNPTVVQPFNVDSSIGMDEDYDAPDLENWFLAVQSADGSIAIPSFHRPGILSAADWTQRPDRATTPFELRSAVRSVSKILRPRQVDHPTSNLRDLVPDIDLDGNGTPDAITYDVDNDGDGTPDSVWLDLGYPVQRADDGTLYKPLFSFMVLGLNGRMPLNTAGNLNARYDVDEAGTLVFNEARMPLFDHASHLGYSPHEINPQYALQNAYVREDTNNDGVPDVKPDGQYAANQQFDNAVDPLTGARHIPVSLTQLRNLLTGTRLYDPNNPGNNGDQNIALVDGMQRWFPNSVVDGQDNVVSGVLNRYNAVAVAGRWGEPDAIPPELQTFNTGEAVGVNVATALHRSLNFNSTEVVHSQKTYLGSPIVPNPVRAGRSPYPDGQYLRDDIDENYDTTDFSPRSQNYPEEGTLHPVTNLPVAAELYDATGMPVLASERIRRFITPIDPSGNGRVYRYDRVRVSGDPAQVFDVGPDARGRVGFFHYFRPPGVPLDADVPIDPLNVRNDGGRLLVDPNIPDGIISYPFRSSRHNRYRGYESLRNPGGRDGNGDNLPDYAGHMAAMPYNRSNKGPGYAPRVLNNGVYEPAPPDNLYDDTTGALVGTFDRAINSDTGINDTSITTPLEFTPVNNYPLGSLQYNDPGEMNLYQPDGTDAPFGPQDLEYLYRRQDIDGEQLSSRLSDLAPVSFEWAVDNLARRRMFSVETWDRIDYTFAHDNPNNLARLGGDGNDLAAPFEAPGDPARATVAQASAGQINARFPNWASASIENLNLTTPAVVHRGRRINLNQPLPHSYDPFEPVRQKWITETYETLKRILPPQSIDTPQELSKLGQFVVNIIDFRDPDNTITIWTNPDLWQAPARRYDDGGGTIVDLPPSIHLPYRADGTADPDFGVTGNRLVHYGMEYQPVALNEVLGFRFNYHSPSGGDADQNARALRLYIELANMLTEPGPGSGNASNLDLEGWDFVLVKEEPSPTYDAAKPYFHPVYVRPDPNTGQLPAASGIGVAPIVPDDFAGPAPTGASVPVVVGSGKKVTIPAAAPTASTPTPLPTDNPRAVDYLNVGLSERVRALDPSNTNPRHYVIAGTRYADGAVDPTDEDDLFNNQLENSTIENNNTVYDGNDWDLLPPADDPDTTDDDPTTTRPEGRYYWLYLRRPANPLLPPNPYQNNGHPYNPMVVVDSIRFPISNSNGRVKLASGAIDTTNSTEPTQPIYSIERPQPYRGGQLVPAPDDPRTAGTEYTTPLFIYGTSEQARPCRDDGDGKSRYVITVGGSPQEFDTTDEIKHTINEDNEAARVLAADGGGEEDWDYLPFNDRDFISVAELLLVPGCPPGLFTKQFVSDVPMNVQIPTAPSYDAGTGVPSSLGAFFQIPPPTSTAGSLDFDYIPRPWNEGVGREPTPGVSRALPATQVRTYPYLVSEFFYASDPAYTIDPSGTEPHRVGGPTGAGWHRMLELFEIPAPVLDAIGPVAQGINFDWFRQDRRPGQLNLNLIVDEEVFFGLLDDPRLLNLFNLHQSVIDLPIPPATVSAEETNFLPRVVTQVNAAGLPTASSPVANRGFTVFTVDQPTVQGQPGMTLNTQPTSLAYPFMSMKHPFADFLKQRHGGSGFLFGFGSGPTGTGTLSTPAPLVARDRAYRSLSHFDLHQTLLRPATMDPSGATAPQIADPAPAVTYLHSGTTPTFPVADPAIRGWIQGPADEWFFDRGYPYQPNPADLLSLYPNPVIPGSGRPVVPPIPPRRLFQIPDIANAGATPPIRSNAALDEISTPVSETTDYTGITTTNTSLLGNGATMTLFPNWQDPTTGTASYLGGSGVTTPPGPAFDMRRHPYYRTELIQKLMNLTTPRTHQYAVWVTVGFFEVVRPGDRAQLVPDELGPELGSASGGTVRHRSFYILDRSRATGYDPRDPGDYREVVVWSRRIE